MHVSYELTLGVIQLVQFLKRLGRDERGATAVEYGLILGLIFLTMLGTLNAFGQEAIAMWNRVASEIQSAR